MMDMKNQDDGVNIIIVIKTDISYAQSDIKNLVNGFEKHLIILV